MVGRILCSSMSVITEGGTCSTTSNKYISIIETAKDLMSDALKPDEDAAALFSQLCRQPL
jgi:hypothetical protein